MLDRDIITIQDVAALKDHFAAERSGEATEAPGIKLGPKRGKKTTPPVIPEPDSWNQRLLKYIPGEAIGLYLALDRAVHTAPGFDSEGQTTNLAFWLGIVLAAYPRYSTLSICG